MNPLDYKYTLLISSRLVNFKEVNSDLYNFRCFYCGDSKKNAHKSRGYLFVVDGNTRYKCHNCGASETFSSFLKDLDSSIYTQYRLEKFKNKPQKRNSYSNVITKTDIKSRMKTHSSISALTPITDLPDNNDVKKFFRKRMIPEKFESVFYSCSDASGFTDSVIDFHDEEFLAVPYFLDNDHNFDFIQVRSVSRKVYITLDNKNSTSKRKVWGIPHIDKSRRVFAFEAPIDATMVDNSIAMGGVMNNANLEFVRGMFDDLVVAYDADYKTNPHILRQLERLIKNDYSVVLFDRHFVWKDVNQCIMSGAWSLEKLNNYVNERVFSGLRARLEISKITRRR